MFGNYQTSNNSNIKPPLTQPSADSTVFSLVLLIPRFIAQYGTEKHSALRFEIGSYLDKPISPKLDFTSQTAPLFLGFYWLKLDKFR